MTRLAEIRKIYFSVTAASIKRDFARAIELLKQMDSDEERQQAAVYMDGLSQMRSEWVASKGRPPR